jgi:hypothetical protein
LAGRSPGPHERYQDLELRLVRAGRRPLVLPGSSAAAWYCSTTLAGIRPRSLTAMPWSFAQARISPLRWRAGRAARRSVELNSPRLAGMLEERCELLAEGDGVLGAEVDLIVRATEAEPYGLIGWAAVKVVLPSRRYGHGLEPAGRARPALVVRPVHHRATGRAPS